MNELIKYETEHGEVQLSADIIRKYLVPANTNVSDQEVMMFLELCKYQKLNPFLREVYLVKYGNFPASMVTGKEVFTKRASKDPNFNGMEAGITVIDENNNLIRRDGSLLLSTERIVGGWCRVHLKDTAVPFFEEVSYAEYVGRKSDGSPTGMWATKPATMIRKVAIVHTLREAFPESFEGLYSQEEINTIDASALPTAPVSVCTPLEPAQETKPVQNTYTPIQQPVTAQPPVCTGSAQATMARPSSGTVDYGSLPLNFGSKHKGKTIREVAQDESSYLTWVVEKSNAADVTKNNIKAYLASMKIGAKPVAPVAKDVTPQDDDSGYVPPSDSDMPSLPFDI